jgi:regulator of protease activity HflC (stomatin/prohibitin superfamily)
LTQAEVFATNIVALDLSPLSL